jgi:hypothetical protein
MQNNNIKNDKNGTSFAYPTNLKLMFELTAIFSQTHRRMAQYSVSEHTHEFLL